MGPPIAFLARALRRIIARIGVDTGELNMLNAPWSCVAVAAAGHPCGLASLRTPAAVYFASLGRLSLAKFLFAGFEYLSDNAVMDFPDFMHCLPQLVPTIPSR